MSSIFMLILHSVNEVYAQKVHIVCVNAEGPQLRAMTSRREFGFVQAWDGSAKKPTLWRPAASGVGRTQRTRNSIIEIIAISCKVTN